VQGALTPGTKLKIGEMQKRYDCGATPIREALNRLAMERFAVQADQRGFVVAPISIEDLAEITEARCLLYTLLLPLSIKLGDDKWEESVVLAHHRLGKFNLKEDYLSVEGRLAHKRFHRALVSASPSQFLIEMLDILFDFADRYRFIAASKADFAARQTASREHDLIVEHALRREADDALEILQRHVREATSLLHNSLVNEGLG
tara:strand:+ start:1342 stop:1953 length:612 start_codon:yes stop_codon:yes gene_type:complete